MKLIPRVYQREATSVATKALRKTGRALVVMATGLGKTLTSAMIAGRIGSTRDKRPGLFLVHNNDILESAMKEYLLVFPNARFGVFNGQTKKIDGSDIVFASNQAMYRNLSRFSRRYFKWIVCDEGHHFHARTFKQVIQHFSCPRFAVTATPDRLDMQDIRELFGPEVVNISLELAIARGWLPRIEYHLVTDSTLNETYLRQLAKQVLEDGERISLDEIKKRLFVRTREEKVADIVTAYNEKTVIFCQGITHADNVSRLFKASATYHSGNSRQENQQALQDLRDGLVRRVCAVNAFNEGIDVPDVGLVVFARSTQSETIVRQQLGRGLRPGKDKLVVLDFAGNIERIRMIHRIVQRVAEIYEQETPERELGQEGFRREPFVVSGHGFEFTFSQQVVDMMNIFDRLQVNFYPTWQEASQAAKNLGIETETEYRWKYKGDPRLPRGADRVYPDFPGYTVFLDRLNYPTWQEASTAARGLVIKSRRKYLKKYKEDHRLPANPDRVYSDFPGWKLFLGTEKYKTWQEASQAARRLGIKAATDYRTKCKSDSMLPSSRLQQSYSDFPGWDIFLGRS